MSSYKNLTLIHGNVGPGRTKLREMLNRPFHGDLVDFTAGNVSGDTRTPVRRPEGGTYPLHAGQLPGHYAESAGASMYVIYSYATPIAWRVSGSLMRGAARNRDEIDANYAIPAPVWHNRLVDVPGKSRRVRRDVEDPSVDVYDHGSHVWIVPRVSYSVSTGRQQYIVRSILDPATGGWFTRNYA